MKVILPFIKPYRTSVTVALLLMLVELVVELWHPLLLARMTDQGIIAHDFHAVLLWGAMMVVIALIGFASGIINTFYASDASQGFAFDLRSAMFGKLVHSSYAEYNRYETSSLLTRLTGDVNQLQLAFFLSLRVFLRIPLVIVGSLIMAVMVDARLSLLLILVTPVLFGVLGWSMKRGFGLFRSVQNQVDRMNGVLRENILGIRLIRAFGRGVHENRRFTNANDDLQERTSSALRLAELTIPSLLLIMNLSVLIILWLGSERMAAWQLQVGAVLAVVNYAARITAAFSTVSMIVTSLSRAKASSDRIAELLRLEDAESPQKGSALETGAAGLSCGVVFEQVGFRYPDTAAAVLSDVTFEIKPGQTAVIIGATGSGKTSLLQLLPRIYENSEGTIRLDGTDIRFWPDERLRGQIGYVPQEAQLFTGTIKDNLLWGEGTASMDDVIEAAQRAQIHGTIMNLPHGYDTVVGQKGSNLSGGQRQRLTIARALLRKPKLLLLDDCTSALDAATEEKLLAALKLYPCTTLLVTNKIASAQSADTVLLLDNGKLLAQGDHNRLLAQSELYRRIADSQRREELASNV
ncbi:ABC transporter ATP-binding protein [Paenibacillus thalictri]|uniref:ABC transporter ATP-binding protein n=1 Tax=Paenibacillus thalictri TaxID=2527873 RepID=A0A4Q9DTR0_9BACL|nr:ABC transporter ATP-binding protein [Paenibacillus thalictri]TBL79090.1 ABC transporter ATP-binding protein [Paenibacillus thalictri]